MKSSKFGTNFLFWGEEQALVTPGGGDGGGKATWWWWIFFFPFEIRAESDGKLFLLKAKLCSQSAVPC